jgi:transposase
MKEYYVGVDLHKRFSQVTVIDKNGGKVDERRIDNDREVLSQYFSRLPAGTGVAVESTSNWYWLAEVLEEAGMEMSLSHPLKTKLIASARVKTDRIDANCLAQLLRTNFLPTCHIPDKEQRELKQLIRYRISLVRMRTKLKNAIQNVLAARNIEVPEVSDLFGKKGKEFLRGVKLDQMDRLRVDGYLRVLEVIEGEIKELNKMVRERAKESEEAKRLMTIPGISYFSALTILSEIGDINRFPKAKHLASYAGLNPSVRESADKLRRGHISRMGSSWLRWIMVECAQVAARRSRAFKSFHQRIRNKKGYNMATVATARKMLEVIYHVLKDRSDYKEALVNTQNVFRPGEPVFSTGPEMRPWG